MEEELYDPEPVLLTGEHENFPMNPVEFGYKYFEDEEENSKAHLIKYKELGRWFGQIAYSDRDKVLKQWREMSAETDMEWMHDQITSKLFHTEETSFGLPVLPSKGK